MSATRHYEPVLKKGCTRSNSTINADYFYWWKFPTYRNVFVDYTSHQDLNKEAYGPRTLHVTVHDFRDGLPPDAGLRGANRIDVFNDSIRIDELRLEMGLDSYPNSDPAGY